MKLRAQVGEVGQRARVVAVCGMAFVRDELRASVVLMPQVWTPDDLQFADVRAAYFESAGQVAADLLAAADQPRSRLKGVTVAEASLRAVDLLITAGDRDRAAMIARHVLGDVRRRPEKLAAACLLGRAGDQAAVEALVAPALSALHDRPGQPVIMEAVALALDLANGPSNCP